MIHFYPTLWHGTVRSEMPERHYLLAASSWARFRRRDGSIRPASLPAHIVECAVDPGAYAAARRGGYPFTFSQYLQWLSAFHPDQIVWAGTMDFCCSVPRLPGGKQRPPPSWVSVAAEGDFVREQQIKTSVNAYETFWSCRDTPFPWVPSLQGITVEQYVRHAQELRPLVAEMLAHYGANSAFRVGIGSLCRPLRQGELHEIIAEVASILPEGTHFHLWGVKLAAFRHMRTALPECVISCDSSMWNGGQKRTRGHGSVKEWKASGKTQMAFAYDHLPKYEQEIEGALARARLQRLPLEEVRTFPSVDPNAIIQEAQRQFLDALRDADRGMDEIPYPYGLHQAFESFDDDDEWFIS